MALVHGRELGLLGLRVRPELAAFDVDLALHQLVLGRDADPFTRGHADRTGDGTGDAGEAHHRGVEATAGEPDHEQHVRGEAVAHAEHGSTGQSAGDLAMTRMRLGAVEGVATHSRHATRRVVASDRRRDVQTWCPANDVGGQLAMGRTNTAGQGAGLGAGQMGDEWAAATRAALGDDAPTPRPAAARASCRLRRAELAEQRGDRPAARSPSSPTTAATSPTTLMHFAEAGPQEWRFRVYVRGHSIPLADLLPLLDHLGLPRHRRARVPLRARRRRRGGLHDVGVRVPDGVDLDRIGTRRGAARVRRRVHQHRRGRRPQPAGAAAGLTARQVEVLRAYARYLRQIGFPFSQQYIEATLVRHGPIAALLVALFTQRFDPALAIGCPAARRELREPHRRRARRRAQPRRRSHAARTAGARRRHGAHQRVPAGRRTRRTAT